MTISRVIPDIHVLLSGATSRDGLARSLYLATQRYEVQFVLSDGHFHELRRVLTYPGVLRLGGRITPSDAFGLAVELFQTAEILTKLERLDWPSCPDPKDWYLLDLFMASGADAIISRDKHLLRLRDSLNLPIFDVVESKRLGLF